MEKAWLETNSSFKGKIIGKLLGDGCITVQKGRKPRFQFTHTASDYDWIYYCYILLNEYLPLQPPKFKKVADPRLKTGYSSCHYVQSRTSDIITYLRSQWYANSRKTIPFGQLTKYFNEQSLAWWYMDDGHLKQNKKPEKIILSTDSFSREENHWLIDFLHKKYSLYFHLDKQNRLILYNQFQIYYFLHLVTPYLHSSMHRKTIKYYRYGFEPLAKRTTIYLPETIRIQSPTKEINAALKLSLKEIIAKYKNGTFYSYYFQQNRVSAKKKAYQIVINAENLSLLHFLNEVTGLTYSKIAELCFQE